MGGYGQLPSRAMRPRLGSLDLFRGIKPSHAKLAHCHIHHQNLIATMSAQQWSFDDLPTDLQLRVLSYLTVQELGQWVAPVCSKWQALAAQPHLWTTIRLEATSRWIPLSIFYKAPFLKELVLVNRPDATQILKAVANNCPLLRRLVLRVCQVSGSQLLDLSHKCPELESLELGTETRLLGTDGYAAATQFTHLRRLVLIDQNVPALRRLLADASRLLQLNCLELDGATRLLDFDVESFLQQRRNGLLKLRLDAERLGTHSFQAVSTCHNLESLSITNAWRMTDADLEQIFQNIPNLCHFRLHRAFRLTPRGLIHAFSICPSLTRLDLDEVPGANDSLVQLASTRFQSLTHLGLSRCRQVSDYSVICITKQCPSLELLDISWLDGVTEMSLDDLTSDTSQLPRLRAINLFQCHNLQRESAIRLKQSRPGMVLIGAASFPDTSRELKLLADFYTWRTGISRPLQAQLRVIFNHTFREPIS